MSSSAPIEIDKFRSRVEKYIRMVENALLKIKVESKDNHVKNILELAKTYLQDSKYYLGKNDLVTALATISYAEGLIDALARMGFVKVEWEKPRSKKVVVAGTFDIVHPGHIEFLNIAAKYGDLYVIVARDSNVPRDKGREPVFPEDSRRFIVESLKPVKKAVLGDEKDYLKPIIDIKPDIIVLGPDQKVCEEQLKRELAKRGLGDVEIIRVKERVNELKPSSSTQVILNIIKKFCYTNKHGSEKYSL